jgi:hypothetical protein
MITRFLGFVFSGLLLLSCSSLSNSADQSRTVRIRPRGAEAEIRNKILKHTPLGSSSAMVLTFIQTQLPHEGMPNLRNWGARKRSEIPGQEDQLIGSKSFESVEVGWFWELQHVVPLKTYVYVSWGFDAQDRLIDVVVYKATDGP